MAAAPFFSIVTPVYDPPAPVLQAMLDSVRAQTFQDWELCLADDCSPSPHVRQMLDKAARQDSRIRVHYRTENGGISAGSNDGLGMARGEFVALLDHDDELHPEALARNHAVLTANPEIDYVYSDEDKIDEEGNHSGVFLKPDWSPDRLRTQNYVCHFSVIRRSLLDEVGGFDSNFDGSQDWDLMLRITEAARQVHHIPEVLYHWRIMAGSAAGDMTAKPYAYTAGVKAIQAHCDRTGFQATAVLDEVTPGLYHLQPNLRAEPLVSIVIPTAGSPREIWGEIKVMVEHGVQSIVGTSTYQNYEIVLVVDELVPKDVIERVRAIAGDRLTVAVGPRPFNFSERINVGALAAHGEYLLMLNDDIQVVTPGWIERMLMYASHPGVGVVGPKLLFADGRLQHVGVVFHYGIPGHLYRGFTAGYPGYWGNTIVTSNYLAVTGACMMSRRELFEEVGGMSPRLPLNYNDIDYCLKLHSSGHRVVFDPDTVLYHFELSTREAEVAPWEDELLRRRWERVTDPDPFSNDDLLRTFADVHRFMDSTVAG